MGEGVAGILVEKGHDHEALMSEARLECDLSHRLLSADNAAQRNPLAIASVLSLHLPFLCLCDCPCCS